MAPYRVGRTEVGLQKVIFDSSFLMAVATRPTRWSDDIERIVGGFEPVILDCVKEELQSIASGKSKRAKAARLSLEMASAFRSEGSGMSSVDGEIVSAALTMQAAVATNDLGLARTLEAAHVRVIRLRGGRAWSG